MNVLLVYAHPEPTSFNAALRDAAIVELEAQGHTVEVSDLYGMKFKPTIDTDDFVQRHDPQRLNVSLEQRHAHASGSLAPDIATELLKLQQADLLVLQFPLWWFGMPAILKGWIDRVFVSGAVYGRTALFERGKLRGKRALVSVTTGAPSHAFGPGAINGDILSLLAPLHIGVLAFTGMTVLPPHVAYHVPYAGLEGRATLLEAYRQHLRRIDDLVPVTTPRLADHPEWPGTDNRPQAH